jgi:alkylation response protein AidB-like acyl-CoA dehydrogenase
VTTLAAPLTGSATRADWRAFVDAEVAPAAAEADRTGRMSAHVLARTGELGLWGAVLTGVGDRANRMARLGMVHEEIGRGCSGLRSLLTVHSMAAFALDRWGSAGARQRWLARVESGELLGAFCLTEPGAGSDVAALTATATRTGEGFVLNGHKKWITGGQLAGLLLTFARTERGISAFLVDAAGPGVHRTPVHGMLGTNGSMLAEIRFDDCRLPEDALVGADGMGLAVATGVLDIGRLSVASGCVGIIDACLDASVGYASTRRQGGSLLRDHQLVQKIVTDMSTDLRAARLLCGEAAALKDRGDSATITATCVAKYFASTAAMRAAGDAVQLHGALGCAEDAPVARYFRDAKVMEIIEGSTQIQQALIANATFQTHGGVPRTRTDDRRVNP